MGEVVLFPKILERKGESREEKLLRVITELQEALVTPLGDINVDEGSGVVLPFTPRGEEEEVKGDAIPDDQSGR